MHIRALIGGLAVIIVLATQGCSGDMPGALTVVDGGPDQDSETGTDSDGDADSDSDSDGDADSDSDSDSDADTDTDTDSDTDSDTDGDTDTGTDTWAYSANLTLNTTASGAHITVPVRDFPVLVRLTSANFDFDEAKDNGHDIRFKNALGTPLPHEIESWSKANERAAIWVKADVIEANTDDQTIEMLWGNPFADDISDGKAVFQTANHFAAVWHLNEQGNTAADGYRDSTDNQHHGTGTNFSTDHALPAIAGNGQYFDGTAHIRVQGHLARPANVTLSGWFTTEVNQEGELLSIGNVAVLRMADHNTQVLGVYWNGNDWSLTGYEQTYEGTGWHHFAYVFDDNTNFQGLYVDGLRVAQTSYLASIDYDSAQTPDTLIGKHWQPNEYQLLGLADEVRTDSTPRSPHWLKLCYENQRPEGQSLIEYP